MQSEMNRIGRRMHPTAISSSGAASLYAAIPALALFPDIDDVQSLENRQKSSLEDTQELNLSKDDLKTLMDSFVQHPEPPVRRKKHLLKRLLLSGCLLLLVLAAAWSGLKVFYNPINQIKRNIDPTPYQNILTAEEVRLWSQKSVGNSAYVDMNLKVPVIVSTQEANLRIINPPYSAYASQVTLYLAGSDTSNQQNSLFQSDILYPGTVLEKGRLNIPLTLGEYNATVIYTFYDENMNKVKTYQMDIMLEVEETEHVTIHGPDDSLTPPS